MCKIWLTTRPQSQAGIELRRICAKLHLISNPDERDYWIASLVRWHEQHKDFINEKSFNADSSRYWYKRKMVRRSFMVVKKALPNMFCYIDNPRILKTTNGLESFFGHIKGNLNIHRGLSHAIEKSLSYVIYSLKTNKMAIGFLSNI
jgi:hypothetical protein